MTAPHLSTLRLHRVVAGEHTPYEVSEHLQACGACRDRMDIVLAEKVEFAADPALATQLSTFGDAMHSPSRQVPIVANRKPRYRGLASASAAIVACGAALTLVLGIRRDDDRGHSDEVGSLGVRRKGSGNDALHIIRRDARGNIDVLANPAQVRPGDAIRFEVNLARLGFVAVIGIDAARTVTAYAPDRPTLTEVAAGAPRVLDGSIILDDTLGPERIVLVICETARPVEEVMREARDAVAQAGGDPRGLDAISSCSEVTHMLEKVR